MKYYEILWECPLSNQLFFGTVDGLMCFLYMTVSYLAEVELACQWTQWICESQVGSSFNYCDREQHKVRRNTGVGRWFPCVDTEASTNNCSAQGTQSTQETAT